MTLTKSIKLLSLCYLALSLSLFNSCGTDDELEPEEEQEEVLDPSVSASFSTSVIEGTTVSLTVILENPGEGDVTVKLTSADGTAKAGEDYATIETTFVLNQTKTEASIDLETFADADSEETETIQLSIDVTNAELSSDTESSTEISLMNLEFEDDDFYLSLEVDDEKYFITRTENFSDGLEQDVNSGAFYTERTSHWKDDKMSTNIGLQFKHPTRYPIGSINDVFFGQTDFDFVKNFYSEGAVISWKPSETGLNFSTTTADQSESYFKIVNRKDYSDNQVAVYALDVEFECTLFNIDDSITKKMKGKARIFVSWQK